jgi:glycerol-3-phosphate O-acyltransferase
MKQTAVEWLIEQLIEMDKQLDGRGKNEDATVIKMNPTKIYEQAKAMEKEHIEDAYDQMRCVGNYENGKQYYNETYETKAIK